jgi:hypothetical protein
MLAGRLVALMQFGAYLPRYRQLRSLMEASRPDQVMDEMPTIRIDGPHGTVHAPKRRSEPAPLRRSA